MKGDGRKTETILVEWNCERLARRARATDLPSLPVILKPFGGVPFVGGQLIPIFVDNAAEVDPRSGTA
jgi:hypothetical protein